LRRRSFARPCGKDFDARRDDIGLEYLRRQAVWPAVGEACDPRGRWIYKSLDGVEVEGCSSAPPLNEVKVA
jgi:hypothetical protein